MMYYDEQDKRNKTRAAILLLWLVASISAGVMGYNYTIKNIGYMPEQPTEFSHETHSGKIGIKCLACHFPAEIGDNASAPTVKLCVGCHIGLTTQPDKTAYLLDRYDKNARISWNRIYKLPDYVRFSHSRHIRAMLDCSSCHGEVETMKTIFQVKEMTMKGCLNCHREPENYIIKPREISGIYTDESRMEPQEVFKADFISINLNEFEHRALNSAPSPARAVSSAPLNCSSCHY